MTSLIALAMLQQADSSGFNAARLAEIPVRMAEFSDNGTVAGTVVLVQRNGKVVLLDAQGKSRLNPDRPMKTDTVFQVMSMTKPIVCVAAMMLVEEGKLRLDAPVADYLPAFANAKVKANDELLEPRRSILVRHLMTHTSGLTGTDPGDLTDDAKRKLTLAEYAAKFDQIALQSHPGEEIRYSGPGISALGRIIEIVSGQKLEDFLQTRIFNPLKMQDTTFFLPQAKEPRLAHMYYQEDGKLTMLDEDPMRPGARFANPAGGLYSTASDMGKFINCLATGGAPLLSPAALRTMTINQTGDLLMDNNDALGYGLGFTVVRTANGTNQLKPIGTFGHTGAFGTEFWTDPKTGVSAVFMAQGFGNASTVRKVFNTMVNSSIADK